MSWRLFLDDERNPTHWFVRNRAIGEPLPEKAREGYWIICRSADEAKKMVAEKGCLPSLISFDHDLGLGESGHDFAKWLIEQDINGTFSLSENFEYEVHSQNPVGKANIHGLMDGYLRFKETTC